MLLRRDPLVRRVVVRDGRWLVLFLGVRGVVGHASLIGVQGGRGRRG
jgi:hypothetical protein